MKADLPVVSAQWCPMGAHRRAKFRVEFTDATVIVREARGDAWYCERSGYRLRRDSPPRIAACEAVQGGMTRG